MAGQTMNIKTHVKQLGFTLHEMLLGIAVFLILGGLGVPSYVSYVRNGELSGSGVKMMSDIYYARSEAIKRRTDVVICRSTDVTVASPVCGGNNNDWSDGWLVFVDAGGTSGEYDAGTDTLLRVSTPQSNNVTVTSNNTANTHMNFQSDGSLSVATAPAAFAICDDRDQDGDLNELNGRLIEVELIGRPILESGQIASCDAP